MPGESPDYNQIIQTLIAERDELKEHCARLGAIADQLHHPPGHFYSPLADVHDALVIQAAENRLDAPPPSGIDFEPSAIEGTLRRLAAHYPAFDFPRHPQAGYRFHFDNAYFGAHDAVIFFAMLLEFRPRRVVEIGSGFSSRLLLDVSERHFSTAIDITLIDPWLPDVGSPAPNVSKMPVRLQEVPLEVFDALEENDILFIDSSHVAKTASDVNHYFFQILPRLRPGVLIHIHDIFYPFEYPAAWVLGEKRNWNEAYLLHAFLQFNPAFQILYWADFATHFLATQLTGLLPLCRENTGGSFWMRKIQ